MPSCHACLKLDGGRLPAASRSWRLSQRLSSWSWSGNSDLPSKSQETAYTSHDSAKLWQIFRRISLPPRRDSSIMAGIGATTPRLHGFHRFLPRLWELFYWPCFHGDLASSGSSGTEDLSHRSAVRLCPPQRGELLRRQLLGGSPVASRSGPCVGRQNRNNPDFRFSLPILLNWYGRRIRYYPHVDLRADARRAIGPMRFHRVSHGRGRR